MRVSGYYRVSSSQQRDAQTIDSQRTAARAVAAARGWELVAEYEDDGRSARTGKLDRRTGMTALLTAATARRFDVVVVVDSDRLARSEDLIERAHVYGTLQRAGVLLSIAGADLRPADDAMVQIKAMFDADENRKRADRSRRGRARTAAAGRPPCAPPLGLAFDRSSNAWIATSDAELVREVFARAAAGESCSRIALDLAQRDAPLPRGGHWHASSVARILRTAAYDTGRWRANHEAAISVPALVDPGTAAAARARLAGNRKAGLRRTMHVYLLEAIARCGVCGAAIRIHGETRRKGARVYRYVSYVCAKRRERAGGCTLPRFRTAALDARLWAAVASWIADPELVREALEARGGAATDAGRAALADLDEWRRRLEQSTALELEALGLRDKGALSAAALEARLRDLARRRALLERQIAAAEEMTRDAATAARVVADLAGAVEALRREAAAAGVEERRRIVKLVCDAWTVQADGSVEGEAAIGWAARRLVVVAS